MKTKVTKRGQTVVPAGIRKRFNLGMSSTLEWMVEGDVITVYPISKSTAHGLRGAMKGDVSFQDFMDDRRLDRDMEKKKDLSP